MFAARASGTPSYFTTSLPKPVGRPLCLGNFLADCVIKGLDLQMLGFGRAGERERIPLAVAAKGGAFGNDGVVLLHDVGGGIGDRAVGPEVMDVFADALHGGVVAELFQPFGRRQPLKYLLEPRIGGRGMC